MNDYIWCEISPLFLLFTDSSFVDRFLSFLSLLLCAVVALWWPWDEARIFAPWRPIPVSPIGASFISERGLKVLIAELLPSLPLIAYGVWPIRKG